MKYIEIDGRKIGASFSPYIVAEISANHNGDIAKALRLIELAKECGADAVKIQTYTPDTMTIISDRDDFKIKGGLWDGRTLYDLYEEAHTPWEWHKELFAKAKEVGITMFSTPFDETAVDFLMDLDVPAFKIASFEMTDHLLVDYIARQGRPIIISTGLADQEEIAEALEVIKRHHDNVVVLHCVSSYPAPPEESNLRTISDLAQRFDVVSGLSDHTLGTVVAMTSVALGSCLIEKHFIEDILDKGPDSDFSLTPKELKQLINDVKIAYRSMGKAGYERKKAEKSNLVFRRSIYFVKDMKQGEIITSDCIRRIRPGYGLPPKYFNDLIGKSVLRDVEKGMPVEKVLISSL